ncbi:MAG: hypothetical protein K6G07_02135 [Lachnospiraceae bacterium]|nr:hypothetical protein [Lachnospiraceae bacterium]
MKISKKLVSVLLLTSMVFALTACSPQDVFTAKTTHSVVVSETNQVAFEVELNANEEEGYAWYGYTTTGGFDQEDYDVQDGFFNHTLTEHYKYIIRTDDKIQYYLILVKNKNLDTAKVYPYEIKLKDGATDITEGAPFNIAENMKLYKAVSNDVPMDK